VAHLRNSPDPLSGSLPRKDLVSWNLYNYSRGDPVNNRDPIGTWNEDDDFTEFDVPASAIGRGTWRHRNYAGTVHGFLALARDPPQLR